MHEGFGEAVRECEDAAEEDEESEPGWDEGKGTDHSGGEVAGKPQYD